MNTSSENWPDATVTRKVHSFHYPVIAGTGFRQRDAAELSPDEITARQLAIQQQVNTAVEAARTQGLRQGEAQAQAAAAQELEQTRAAIATLLHDFSQQRAQYFARVEGDVVRLALAIARKVLRREAQMDPLLLAGIVRVALDQMQAGTRVALRVAPGRTEAWQEWLTRTSPTNLQVEVLSDQSLDGYSCRLEAEAGTTELSLETQLQEIESGFLDLLRGDAGAGSKL